MVASLDRIAWLGNRSNIVARLWDRRSNHRSLWCGYGALEVALIVSSVQVVAGWARGSCLKAFLAVVSEAVRTSGRGLVDDLGRHHHSFGSTVVAPSIRRQGVASRTPDHITGRLRGHCRFHALVAVDGISGWA